ncbi:MAG: hypothetical protein HYX71_05875 [Opitutae bacterium]|nr:hypothetical protein [Opitutae bacterium]
MTSRAQQVPGPGGKTNLNAVITVAAVYLFFLIFAQFGFLKAVQAALGEGIEVIRPILAVMGLAGVAGSVLAARICSERNGARQIMAGFGVCVVAAAGSLGADNLVWFQVVAALTGLGVGLTTVALAGLLRRAVGDAQLGRIIGVGTGLAYAFCNLPGIFDADATTQALIGMLAGVAGWAGCRGLTPRFSPEPRTGGEYARAGVAAWVLVLAALVGLDSAAFYHIQHNADLIAATWAGPVRLTLNAGVHLGAALLAGWALDRGWLGRTTGLGAAALLLACGLINGWPPTRAWAGLLYVAGVSVYSVALVCYPARSGRPGLAALIYAVAGWGGSALGIGLAEGQQELSPVLIGSAGTIVLVGFLLSGLNHRQTP